LFDNDSQVSSIYEKLITSIQEILSEVENAKDFLSRQLEVCSWRAGYFLH
jgi:hypothetical protein